MCINVCLGHTGNTYSHSYRVTLFESIVGLHRLVVLKALSCTYAFHGAEQEKEVHGVLTLTLIICVSCNAVNTSVGFVSSCF